MKRLNKRLITGLLLVGLIVSGTGYAGAEELSGPQEIPPPQTDQALPETAPPAPQEPEAPEETGQPEEEPRDIITHVLLPHEMSPAYDKLLFLDPLEGPSGLSLPKIRFCLLNGSTRTTYKCPVLWDLDALDMSAAGWQNVPGVLLPEDGYAFGENISAHVSYPVWVPGENPTPEQLTKVELNSSKSIYILPKHGALEDLPLDSLRATCYTSQPGVYFKTDLIWDLSSVDPSRTGTYTITGQARLPEGIVAPENHSESFKIGVVEPDAVDLSAVEISASGPGIKCYWHYVPKDPESVVLEYAIGKGPWQEDPGGGDWKHWRYGFLGINGNSLGIDRRALELDTDYYFRLRYEGDRLSNVLHLRFGKDDYVFDVSDMGGDRDGGDQEEQEFPPMDQPSSGGGRHDSSKEEKPPEPVMEDPASSTAAPPPDSPVMPDDSSGSAGEPSIGEEGNPNQVDTSELPKGLVAKNQENTPVPAQANGPASSPSPRSEAATEEVTDTATIISGSRLRSLLLGSGDTVLFEKLGIAAEVPASFLKELNLEDEDTLEVRIQQPDKGWFRLELLVNDLPLGKLPSTVVRIPWDDGNENAVCVDAEGNFVSEAVWDPDSATVSCTIEATGAYRLKNAAPDSGAAAAVTAGKTPPSPSQTVSHSDSKDSFSIQAWPWILLPASLVLLAGFFFMRRRMHE